MISLNLHPCLSSHARLESDPYCGQPCLLFPEGVLLLNSTAYAILSLCNGEHSVESIIRKLGKRYHGGLEELEKDALDCIEELSLRGYLKLSDPSAPNIP